MSRYKKYRRPSRLKWFVLGILFSCLVALVLGAVIPSKVANFVTQFSDKAPILTESSAGSEEILAREVFAAVNLQRKEHGLRDLLWDEELAKLALDHSQDMAEHDYLTHERSPGYSELPIDCGENCIQMTGYSSLDAHEILEVWMESAGHRQNILGNYRTTGIGIVRSGDIWWGTQIFR